MSTKTLIFILILCSVNIYSQNLQQVLIEQKIKDYPLLDESVKYDSLISILRRLASTNTSYETEKLKELLEITSNDENARPYIHTLLIYGNRDRKNIMLHTKKALRLAEENNYYDLMGNIYVTESMIYYEQAKYDSMMVALINAKDICEEHGLDKELVGILHNTADVYFHVGLFDKAEKYYKEIMEKKGDLHTWNDWRHKVILGNLALIEIERKNFEKALGYLNIAMELNKKAERTNRIDISIGYASLLMAKCHFNLHNEDSTRFFSNQAMKLLKREKQYNELMETYNLKSEYFLENNSIDSSYVYADLARDILDNNSVSISNKIRTYQLLSKIYFHNRNYVKAYSYQDRYASINDSLKNNRKDIGYMQLLAESDIKSVKDELRIASIKNNWFLIATTISLIFTSLLVFNYRKLRSSYRKLVNLSVNVVKGNQENKIVSRKIADKENNAISNLTQESTQQPINSIQSIDPLEEEIICRLTELMQTEKTYLDSSININLVATKLNTNRTYLSKAINNILNKNFNAFINDLRIENAIEGMTSGKYLDMSIEGLGLEVGFSNRTSFNAAFKKYTGVQPSIFINEIRNVERKPENIKESVI